MLNRSSTGILFAQWLMLGAFAVACGTQVDVGNNDKVDPFTENDFGDAAEGDDDDLIASGGSGGESTGSGTSGSGTGDGGSGSGTGGGTGVRRTCWGEHDASKTLAQSVCEILSRPEYARFVEIKDLVCVKNRGLNLIEPSCSWSGSGSTKKYLRYFSKTDLKDTGDLFSSLAGFTTIVNSSLAEIRTNLYENLTDPTFGERFAMLDNTSYQQISYDQENWQLAYKGEINSSVATIKFDAELTSEFVGDDYLIVLDQATGGMLTLTSGQMLRVIRKVDDNTSVLVLFDYKQVNDGGSHLIAINNINDILQQRLNNAYENGQLD